MTEITDHSPYSAEKKTRPDYVIFIISGGVGSSAEQLVRTVLAQFPNSNVSIKIYPKISTKKQVHQILDNAAGSDALVAHTFVNSELRMEVENYASVVGVVAIDLIGSLIEILAGMLDQEPLGKPGMYRQLYKSYFDRIDAMDYTLEHDDGKNPKGWDSAEVVLLGPSRVGKTPISLYLSVLGWKVANIPLVSGISPSDRLFEIDPRRLVGLTISPGELIEHRQHRQRLLGVISVDVDYIDPVKVFEELEAAETYFRRKKIPIVNVTGKPIETSADEILRVVRRNLKR